MGVREDLRDFLIGLPGLEGPEAWKALVRAAQPEADRTRPAKSLLRNLTWRSSDAELAEELVTKLGQRGRSDTVAFIDNLEKGRPLGVDRQGELAALRARIAALVTPEAWEAEFPPPPPSNPWVPPSPPPLPVPPPLPPIPPPDSPRWLRAASAVAGWAEGVVHLFRRRAPQGGGARLRLLRRAYGARLSASPLLKASVGPWAHDRDVRDVFVAPKVAVFDRGAAPTELDLADRGALEALVARHGRVVLVGETGDGKTTVAQHFAVQVASAPPLEPLGACVPIFVRLADLTAGPVDLWAAAQLSVQHVLGKQLGASLASVALDAGRAVLILDGLDETGPYEARNPTAYRRAAIVEALSGLAPRSAAAPPIRLLVTCRRSSFHAEELRSIEPCVAKILPLDRRRADRLVANLRAGEPARGDDGALRRSAIVDLLESPLMVTLYARFGRTAPGGPASSRARFYEHAVGELLQHRPREARRTLSFPDAEAKSRLLTAVAWDLLVERRDGQPLGDFPLELLHARARAQWGSAVSSPVQARSLAAELVQEHGILRMDRSDVYRFAHRSFAEFFAARALGERDLGTALALCAGRGDLAEVLCFHCGLAPPERARALIGELAARRAPLDAGACLVEAVGVPSDEGILAIVGELEALAAPGESEEADRALALLAALMHRDDAVGKRAGRAVDSALDRSVARSGQTFGFPVLLALSRADPDVAVSLQRRMLASARPAWCRLAARLAVEQHGTGEATDPIARANVAKDLIEALRTPGSVAGREVAWQLATMLTTHTAEIRALAHHAPASEEEAAWGLEDLQPAALLIPMIDRLAEVPADRAEATGNAGVDRAVTARRAGEGRRFDPEWRALTESWRRYKVLARLSDRLAAGGIILFLALCLIVSGTSFVAMFTGPLILDPAAGRILRIPRAPFDRVIQLVERFQDEAKARYGTRDEVVGYAVDVTVTETIPDVDGPTKAAYHRIRRVALDPSRNACQPADVDMFAEVPAAHRSELADACTQLAASVPRAASDRYLVVLGADYWSLFHGIVTAFLLRFAVTFAIANDPVRSAVDEPSTEALESGPWPLYEIIRHLSVLYILWLPTELQLKGHWITKHIGFVSPVLVLLSLSALLSRFARMSRPAARLVFAFLPERRSTASVRVAPKLEFLRGG